MILSKDKYYKRRWLLAILFMLIGFLLIYVGFAIFSYDKSRKELFFSNKVPQELGVSYSSNSEKSVLRMTNDKRQKTN